MGEMLVSLHLWDLKLNFPGLGHHTIGFMKDGKTLVI